MEPGFPNGFLTAVAKAKASGPILVCESLTVSSLPEIPRHPTAHLELKGLMQNILCQ
jgi:hypothetical protein